MKLLKSVAEFIYDFVIGDDWKIAAAVVLALAVGALLAALAVFAPVALGPTVAVLLLLAFTLSMVIDVRRKAS